MHVQWLFLHTLISSIYIKPLASTMIEIIEPRNNSNLSLFNGPKLNININIVNSTYVITNCPKESIASVLITANGNQKYQQQFQINSIVNIPSPNIFVTINMKNIIIPKQVQLKVNLICGENKSTIIGQDEINIFIQSIYTVNDIVQQRPTFIINLENLNF